MNKKIFKGFLSVSFWTIISRITGLIRDIFFAWSIGAGPLADAFFVAFRLPNLFRRLTAEGALVQSFLPQFTHKKEVDGDFESLKLASEIQSFVLLSFLVFIFIAEVFMGGVVFILAPGFYENPEKFNMAVYFSRITIIYLPMVSIIAFWGSIAQASGKFIPHASAPIILNLSFVAGCIVVLSNLLSESQIAYIVPLGGLIQLVFVGFWLKKMKILPKIVYPKFSGSSKQVWIKFLPAAFGAGVLQINLLVDTILASFLESGSVSYLYYSDRVAQLPLGIIGIALGTVLLPSFSKAEAKKDLSFIKKETSNSIKFVSIFSIPSLVGLTMMSEIIIQVLFGRGAFSQNEIIGVSIALKAYALGLPAFIVIKVLHPCFFSSGDTSTPFRVSLITVLVNIILSIILMQYFSFYGIALASSISAFLTVIVFLSILINRGRLSLEFLKDIVFLIVIAIPFSIFLYSILILVQTLNIFLSLFATIILGITIWFLLMYIFGFLSTKSFLN